MLAAGVIGFTCVQGLRRFDAVVAPLEPDVVVLAFGAVNEFGLPSFDPFVLKQEIITH